MSINIEAAEQYIHANSRVLERHRLATLLHGAPASRVVEALQPYRNEDGGFGHGLEPDVRCSESQPAAFLHALEALAEVGALGDPCVDVATTWLESVSRPDGGVAQVLPSADGHPRAPWMVPVAESSFLTFVIAGKLWEGGSTHPWLGRATEWCWSELEGDKPAEGYTVKFALDFLDAVPDPRRAAAAVERLRPAIAADGTLPIPGGVEDERVHPIELSSRPGSPSRKLFSDKQIEADLDRLESEQLDDGGWDFGFLHWSDGQAVEWRGAYTLNALHTLKANNRLPASPVE